MSQYAQLCHMIAHVTGMKPGKFVHDITNAHIYENHYEAVELQLTREPKDCIPQLVINPWITNFNDFQPTDIKIYDYEAHPGIKGDVAV